MDPLRELDKEYKQISSEDKNNFKVRHLELLLTAAKKEIIGFNETPTRIKQKESSEVTYQTSSSELITIPTLLVPSIQEELENNRVIEQQEAPSIATQAFKVFGVEEKTATEPEEKETQVMKVVSARKATKKVSAKEELLALNQGVRAKLNLQSTPAVQSEEVVATVTPHTINRIKGYLKTHFKKSTPPENGMRRIKSIRIKDDLEAAEHSTRRQSSIKNMIDALKREDRREEIKSSGVRLGSR